VGLDLALLPMVEGYVEALAVARAAAAEED